MWIKIIDVHLQAEWWLILRSLDKSVMLLLFSDVIAHGIVWEADTVNHYDDVIMDAIASLITRLIIVYSTVYIQTQIKENIKAPRYWPLCGELTGDRWIPRTNGQ